MEQVQFFRDSELIEGIKNHLTGSKSRLLQVLRSKRNVYEVVSFSGYTECELMRRATRPGGLVLDELS